MLVEEFINEINKEYPDLKFHATKQDVSETELRLTKEIENTRKDIKEVELKLTQEIENTRKEIKELDAKLTREIKEVDAKLTREIKELEVRLTDKITTTKTDLIKWVIGLFTLQTGLLVGAVFTMFKLFKG